MDTVQIYERALLGDCLDELKGLRDDDRGGQWYPRSASSNGPSLPHDLCVISNEGELNYEYAIQRSRKALNKGIVRTVMLLLREYGIDAKTVSCGVAEAKVFVVLDQAATLPEDFDPYRTSPIIVSHKGTRTLYILKRFGLGERWPKDLVDYVRERTSADEARFVSLVDERAYVEQINHNDDEDDPTRGTGVLSLRQFFDIHFSPEEYGIFRKYLSRLTEEARSYYGYRVVKSLSPSKAYLFRREVAGAIRAFDYCSADEPGRLSAEQRELLDSQFFEAGMCEALTGTSDFASSFMTAEWLYQSLGGSDRIDLAPIVMDYYKAVEQYLFQFLCLHTEDIDKRTRKIFHIKERWVHLSNKEEMLRLRDGITLRALTDSLGYRDKVDGSLKKKNEDLLRNGVSEDTYALIVDELKSIPVNRNGYFHKDNLYDWGEVEEARKKTIFIFYLLLGSYKFSKKDENSLDMRWKPSEDDFNKLCDYVNECSHLEGIVLRLPVFYLNESNRKEDALSACANTHVAEYDKYGMPKYSGVCFKRVWAPTNEEELWTKKQVHKVQQGVLIIDRTDPRKNELQLPEITIYENGKFLLRGE